MLQKGKQMKTSWESELAKLLNDLLAVQDDLLAILTKKRKLLAASDVDGLSAVGQQEEELIESLKECMARRESLLARARLDGLPAVNIKVLAGTLPCERRKAIQEQVNLAGSRARLLRHLSLTNWVVVQRTLIHLSQLLEIIATGGRLKPTYGREEPVGASGGLIDGAA